MSEEGRGGEPEGFERDTVGARGCVFGTLKGFLNFSGVKRVGEGVKRGVRGQGGEGGKNAVEVLSVDTCTIEEAFVEFRVIMVPLNLVHSFI